MCTVDWTAAAAWVQALGSISAVVAAFLIGRLQSRGALMIYQRQKDDEEKERLRQAEIGARWIAFILYQAARRAKRNGDMLRSMKWLAEGQLMQEDEAGKFKSMIYVLREDWALLEPSVLAQVPMLGTDSAELTLHAAEWMRQYEAALADMMGLSSSHQAIGHVLKTATQVAIRMVDKVETSCDLALSSISKEHGIQVSEAEAMKNG